MLNKQKDSQKFVIPIKIVKDSTNTFSGYLGETVNTK